MTDLTAAPATEPSLIYRMRDGMYTVDLFTAALVELDFFTWLEDHPSDLGGICAAYGFQQRPVDAMTTLFVAQGFLNRSPAGVFTLTPMAREHLVKGSPWWIGPYFPRVKDRPIARDYLTILRTGEPANFSSRDDTPDWHRAMESGAFAAEFTAMMDCRGVMMARALAAKVDLSGRRRLLDIAGGSGVYACSLCAHWPQLRATVLEKPPVDRIAAQAIAGRGFAEKVDTAIADMLREPLPAGYDVHLWSNVLHDWDVPVVQQLLRASAAALPPGGLMVIHDAWLNADKSGPLHAAEYSVLLVHVTQGRCYSTAEMESMLSDAGFTDIRHADTTVARGVMTAVREP